LFRDPNSKPQSSRFYDFEKISSIEPHKNCDYLTKEFWLEMQNLTKDRSGVKMTNDSGDRYLVAKNCTGRLFSVEDNLRTTLFSPEFSTRSYFLFGSSTLHNFEVPNHLTTASMIQKIFSDNNMTIAVHNYGVSGATIENNFARMQAVEHKFNNGDIIVLLFGINDVGLDTYSSSESVILKIFRRLGDKSLLIRIIHRRLARNGWKEHSKLTAKHKAKLLEEINGWATSKNLKFKAILEPVLHLKQNPNIYEVALKKSFGQKLDVLYKIGYEEFNRSLNSEFAASTINVFDQTNPSVFLDQAHINAVGTELLATEIVKLTTLCL
jgi:lysophospholipase L1-like esterase